MISDDEPTPAETGPGSSRGEHRDARRARLVGGLGLGGAVAAVLAVGIGLCVASCGTDRQDATAVGEAFVHAVATGDEDACALATAELAGQLRVDGHCTGDDGPDAQVRVLFSRPCATRGLLGAEVTPPITSGRPYVLVGLARDEQGEWSAASLRTLADRAAVRGGICTTTPDGK